MNPGRLKHRLSFQARGTVSDGYGNEESSDFEEEFRRWAEIKPSLGIETVNAARLQGRQPIDIVVRRDAETLLIRADWQAVDVHEGTIYALRSPAIDMKQDKGFLTFKAEATL